MLISAQAELIEYLRPDLELAAPGRVQAARGQCRQADGGGAAGRGKRRPPAPDRPHRHRGRHRLEGGLDDQAEPRVMTVQAVLTAPGDHASQPKP